MATEITDSNGLAWKASIDYSQIPKDIDAIQKMLTELGVGVIDPESISAPIIEAEKKIQTVLKQNADSDKKMKEEVARAAVQFDNQVFANKERLNENWSATMDEQMKALLDYQDQLAKTGFDGSIIQSKGLPVTERPKYGPGLDEESLDFLNQAKQIYAELDQQTAEYIQELVELEMQLAKVRDTQKALDEARGKDNISAADYAKSTEALAAQELKISESIELVTQRQKDYDAITKLSVGSINEKKVALQQLEAAYQDLSEEERKGSAGTEMSKNIAQLKTEIKGLNVKALSDVKEKTVSAFSELRKLKDEMARNPGSPMFETWRLRAQELQESMQTVRNELKLATSDSAGVDALASGIRGLVGGFTAAAGAVSLFTGENEEAEKAIQTTMGALALLNGVQELSRVLEKESALNVYLTSLMRKKDAAATAIQTAATTAQTAATTGATTATKGLTAAMLSNPATTLVVAITALVGAYLLFRRTSDGVRTSQVLLADASKKVGERYAEQKAKLMPYVEALKDANLTEKQRVSIYENLKSIDERIVTGLDSKTISYQTLTNNVNKYLDSLRMQIRLESREEAIKESIKLEEQRKAEIDSLNEAIRLKKEEAKIESERKINTSIGGSTLGVTGAGGDAKGELNTLIKKRNELVKTFAEQVTISQELSELSADDVKNQETVNNLIAGSVQWYEKLISAKQEEIYKSTDPAKIRVMQDEIKAYQRQIDLLLGKKASTKEANKLENELNSILDKRQSILEDIAGLERDATQSGMLKEQSELDKINEKYDRQLLALQKVNEEIEKYNKKHPNAKQQLLGESETARIETARNIELQNSRYRDDAKVYVESIRQKQIAFEVFQEAQQTGNQALITEARSMYSDQLGEYRTYLQMLDGETSKIISKMIMQPQNVNVGDLQALQELSKLKAEESKRQAQAEKDAILQSFAEIIRNTETFADQRLRLEAKHQQAVQLLREKYKGDDLKQREASLKEFHQMEIEELENAAARQTGIYKKLNQDIVRFTRDQLKERLTDLENILKADSTLTPEMRAALKSYIDQLKELIRTTSDAAIMGQKLVRIAGQIGSVSSALGSIADSAKGVNAELGMVIESLAKMGDLASVSLQAAGSFMEGDIEAGIVGTVQAIGNIFSNLEAKRQSQRVAEQAVLDFQTRILLGEYEMNAIIRQRERDQAALNKLKLDALRSEKKLLEEQQQITSSTYNELLKKLQQEQYISSQGTRRRRNAVAEFLGGALGSIGTSRTEVVNNMASLVGKSFEEIEKLYLQGRLSDKAKQLFEQLKAIKQEGVDIDALLQQNAESLREIFTGTTSDTILDSIVNGFKNGLRSAADFADTFEELMQNAVLNALKYQVLEAPLKEFYEQFAADAQSDDLLTEAEIAELKRNFETIIGDAGRSFEELKKITNVNFETANATSGQGLKGAIKGITEQQAELLAGQFGGLRITAIKQLEMATQHLAVMNDIRYNTSFIEQVKNYTVQSHSILKDIQLNGIKVK